MPSQASQPERPRVTLRTVRRWVEEGRRVPFLTCYDATTARWLWRGGVDCFLVGDTAGQVVLGHETTLGAEMDFMVAITAAVRRGAPDSLIMADMPFGSYQCGPDEAVRNAIRFVTQGGADLVKLEVGRSATSLIERLSETGVPVVAHIGSRPQQVKTRGGYGAVGRTQAEARELVATAEKMVEAGAVMLLVEAVPDEVAAAIVEAAAKTAADHERPTVPVIGCGAGPACHGHVVVVHDLLGLSDWQPPFAKPIMSLGSQIQAAGAQWVEQVRSGHYPPPRK